jgi:hypothetical protein
VRACRGLAEKGGRRLQGNLLQFHWRWGGLCVENLLAFGKLRLSITNQNHDTGILTPIHAASLTLRWILYNICHLRGKLVNDYELLTLS